ncbi:MAG: SCO family protein [Verrucomicrobia bacterium]|nr:SCO family protein [Verrucomicrobiota bacterium]
MQYLRLLVQWKVIGLRAVLCAGMAAAVPMPAAADERASSTAEVKVLDLSLVDQHGLARKLQTDVIGDRLVVVNFIYASCKTSCPMASAVFGQVQERLGSRLGQEVVLVSLSIDPVTDRPARLLATAEQFHAKPGWTWLTGEKAAVDRVLHGLGLYLSNIADHPTMVMIGDGKTGEWIRLLGFPTPDGIMAHLERIQAARGPAKDRIAVSTAGMSHKQEGAE